MTEKCAGCKFYAGSPTRSDQGVCRRYPPTLRVVPYLDSLYPLTPADGYCGEYRECEK